MGTQLEFTQRSQLIKNWVQISRKRIQSYAEQNNDIIYIAWTAECG